MDKPARPATTDYQPLYAQVRALLVQRIGSGTWKPGDMLPNEFQLAAEYNVSQGTVRKALLELEADRLIVRRQGRGTYVARHTRQRALFQFFRMVGLDDRRRTPTSVVLTHRTQRAAREQARHLCIDRGAALHAIVRVRYLESLPAIFERIYVPAALMPGLAVEVGVEMAEEMYVIYQERFGITIARASERLAAVAATAEEARHLGIAEGAPVLEITRVAHAIDSRPAELRVSRCDTGSSRYAAEVC